MGLFFIGFENGNPIATIAIRHIDNVSCEAKRLYIKPDYRGKGYIIKHYVSLAELQVMK